MSAAASEADMLQSTLQPQPQPSLADQHAPVLQLGNARADAGPSKRKRGRPRKCDMPAPHPSVDLPWGVWREGCVIPHVAAPSTVPPAPPPSPVTQQVKRRRVRTRSTTANKGRQVAAAGSGVTGLNTQVITVQPGEDVAMKVASYSCDGWAVCVLSADGVVSSVKFNHAPSSHQTVCYEGYFQILSLSGSYMLLESGELRIRKGGVSISLTGPDGRVFGGGVSGSLTAASLVQVVIGRFPVTSGIQGASSSTERGAMGGSSGRPGLE